MKDIDIGCLYTGRRLDPGRNLQLYRNHYDKRFSAWSFFAVNKQLMIIRFSLQRPRKIHIPARASVLICRDPVD